MATPYRRIIVGWALTHAAGLHLPVTLLTALTAAERSSPAACTSEDHADTTDLPTGEDRAARLVDAALQGHPDLVVTSEVQRGTPETVLRVSRC